MAEKDAGIGAVESEIAAVQMETQDLQLAFNAFNAIYQVRFRSCFLSEIIILKDVSLNLT